MAGNVIYADTGIILRLVEGVDAVRAPIEANLQLLRPAGLTVVVSRLARLECRCKPLRANDDDTLALYDGFFASQEVSLREVDKAVVERATELRARYALKTPDAIHAATAMLAGVSAFWTTDRGFQKVLGLAVEIFPAS